MSSDAADIPAFVMVDRWRKSKWNKTSGAGYMEVKAKTK